MSDLISRQAAIEVADAVWCVTGDTNAAKIWDQIKNLPSAHCDNCPYPDQHVPQEDAVSRQAVKHLDLFTKAYCRDKSVTNDLAFRCKQCDFEMPDGKCLVKTMARKLCPDYKNFGSMVDYELSRTVQTGLHILPSAQPEVLACGEGVLNAQPERTCVNCGRTANNGGWYADGRTRCPIEEHYALPKDGYCHLWEKRNVTDDDYPERREG